MTFHIKYEEYDDIVVGTYKDDVYSLFPSHRFYYLQPHLIPLSRAYIAVERISGKNILQYSGSINLFINHVLCHKYTEDMLTEAFGQPIAVLVYRSSSMNEDEFIRHVTIEDYEVLIHSRKDRRIEITVGTPNNTYYISENAYKVLDHLVSRLIPVSKTLIPYPSERLGRKVVYALLGEPKK